MATQTVTFVFQDNSQAVITGVSCVASVSTLTGAGIASGQATLSGATVTPTVATFSATGIALGVANLLGVPTAVLVTSSIAGIGAQYSGRKIRAPNGGLIVIRDLYGNPKQF